MSDHNWVYYENRAPFDIWKCSECGLMKEKRQDCEKPAVIYKAIYSQDIWPEGSEPSCAEIRLDEALE